METVLWRSVKCDSQDLPFKPVRQDTLELPTTAGTRRKSQLVCVASLPGDSQETTAHMEANGGGCTCLEPFRELLLLHPQHIFFFLTGTEKHSQHFQA